MTADPRTISPVASPDPEHSASHSAAAAHPETSAEKRSSVQIWLRRTRALLFVTVCATFGVLLLILPWTPKWTDNPLLLSYPDLRSIVASGFMRGLSSGLGVLDLWLGFWEAIHYHEGPGQNS